MKSALLDVGVQWVLLQLVQHPLNSLYMLFAFAFGGDEDVIQVCYDKNVKLFCQNLVDLVLKRSRCVGQSKRHNLIFEVTIAGPEGRLPFIAFPDSYSMVGISQIKLGKMLSPT